MKVGVTGGTGFIGQYLLKEYADEVSFVVITARTSMDGLYVHPQVTYKTETYDQEGFERAFEGCDAVVHLGAKRSSKDAEKNILNYTDNLQVSEDLFLACKNLGIKNVVNISSTAVYDMTLETPFEEALAPAPLSRYGAVKLAIEGIAHLYNRNFGMQIKSLRLAQVLGVGERAGYMLSIFQQRCLEQQRLDVYGKGDAGREYVYVKDVAYGIMCALKADTKKSVFNIGSGVFTSNRALAAAFCEAFENPAGYQCLVDKPESSEHYLMNNDLAEQELGYKAKYDLKQALVDMRNILTNK